MKVKTSELKGKALCYAVCLTELPHLVWNETIGLHHASDQVVVPSLPEPDCYSPYTSWAMVGPIIEREGIELRRLWHNQVGVASPNWQQLGYSSPSGYHYCANIRVVDTDEDVWVEGPTPLIAAMRCYIAMKIGDIVEIPDELMEKE